LFLEVESMIWQAAGGGRAAALGGEPDLLGR
jgi:hypothetical protein